jgi:hypothetical protein
MNHTIYKVVIISLFTFIVFGFIDSLFFGIYLSEGFSTFFDKIGLNKNNSDIMVSALSTSTAVIASSYIEKVNKKLFGEIIRSPFMDILGIMIGTYFYIVIIRKYDILTKLLSKIIHRDTSKQIQIPTID